MTRRRNPGKSLLRALLAVSIKGILNVPTFQGYWD